MDGLGVEPPDPAHDQPARDLVLTAAMNAVKDTMRRRPCVLRLRFSSLSGSGSGSTPTPECPRWNRPGSLEGLVLARRREIRCQFQAPRLQREMTCGMNVSTGTRQRPQSPTP